jgi:PqqD family protein of HPr-rel-A system
LTRIVGSDTELDLVWRLASGHALLHRGWDNEFLVYNHCSGDTHLLDSTAMRLLLALQTGPLPSAQLARALSIGGEAFVALLADLESLCLITPGEC